jgi:aminomethyltransferase
MNNTALTTPLTTPLIDEHKKSKAKIVDFAGWQMPVEYVGLRQEHMHVRSKVGLFDVSHMGEIRVKGPKALETLQWITSNDVSQLSNGKAQYSLFTNPAGGIVDDLIVYCLEKDADYLLCVNASNTEKDWEWIQKNNKGADIKNESADWGQIAVQGPFAMDLVSLVVGDRANSIAPFSFIEVKWDSGNGPANLIVARTGYTGEDGCEIFVPWKHTVSLWVKLLEKGENFEVMPIGLGARDTLRTEMKYSLYGHEIDDESNPYEAGLGWVVKPNAKDFIGKEKILATKAGGLKRKLVGFKAIDKGIPRQGYNVVDVDKKVIGKVTSGTVSPSLNENIGIAYVLSDYAAVGTEIFVDIRGRPVKCLVVATPFVNKKSE